MPDLIPIIITRNDISLCGTTVLRPSHIGPSEWITFWENALEYQENDDSAYEDGYEDGYEACRAAMEEKEPSK